jgi:hypothetical protein
MGKVLHASYSGYFPFCIPEGTPENCPWTLGKAMQTYWRIRTWTFSASGIVTNDEDPSDTFPFSSVYTDITSRDFETGEPQTLEERLVCENYFGTEFILRNNAYIDFSSQSGTSGGLYNSGLYGEVIDYREGPLEFFFSANGSSAFNISILGANIPINMIWENDEQDESSYSITSGSATLTPTLWWSYGGTYDTATGNPL